MQLNIEKSIITAFNLEDDIIRALLDIFPFNVYTLDEGLKYLGFSLKPNYYNKEDWNWLLGKLDRKVNIWCNISLSREGRLILVKSILEAIPFYCMALAWIPTSILENHEKFAQNSFR